jgi:hypothetical protein
MSWWSEESWYLFSPGGPVQHYFHEITATINAISTRRIRFHSPPFLTEEECTTMAACQTDDEGEIRRPIAVLVEQQRQTQSLMKVVEPVQL